MQLFMDWMMQIILFILLGTVLELLLPNSNMRKYVSLILGLLLLLILTKPILYLFSVDVESLMNQANVLISQDEKTYSETENKFLNQKSEIEVVQDAYIWNEVSAQMQQEANESLSKYGQEVTEMNLVHDDNNELLRINCVVSSKNEVQEVSDSIEQIEIDTDTSFTPKKEQSLHNQTVKILASVWGVERNLINLRMEGGTN